MRPRARGRRPARSQLSYNLRVLKDGFFALQTPQDLLRKLQHDFERCKANPLDTFAAFDFVVTGTQMHEWAKAAGLDERPAEPLDELVFKLCGDLRNGAKHFGMPRKRPKGLEIREGWVEPGWVQADAFDVGDLIVHLDDREAKVYGKPTISLLELAAMVVAYWEEILL